jgi:hypothetical protein
MDRQLLLAKQEVTYGVDPVTAAVDTIWAEEVRHQLSGQRVKPSPAKPGVGPVASHVYGEYCTVTFKVPLAGSGVAGTAPKWGKLMKASGWLETIVAATSVTYALLADPLTASTSLTLKWRDGNRRVHLVTGFKAKVDFELSAGNRPMLVFTGKGLHNDVTEAGAVLAHADADFSGWLDAKPVASGTTTFAYAAVTGLGLRELSFQQTDNVKFVDVPEQENVRLLGERAFTGKIAITCPLPSVLNLESKWKAGTVDTWSMVHGGTAGNIATINGRSQLVEPSYERNQDGDDIANAGIELVPSSLTTDNDLAVVLT